MKNYNDEECVFIHGRTNTKLIKLPQEWEENIDLTSISVHLTPVGADQKLSVKRVQGVEVHLQTVGVPVDCYYLIIGEVLDKKKVVS